MATIPTHERLEQGDDSSPSSTTKDNPRPLKWVTQRRFRVDTADQESQNSTAGT